VQDSGLPPVRLHDLRHGAASLAHCAGADLKTVQEQLGHTSIVLTADTYTSVLHEQHVKAAAATACLCWPRPAWSRVRGGGNAPAAGPQKTAAGTPTETPSSRRSSTKAKRRQRRPRTPQKVQGRIAGQLYALVTAVRRVGLEPTTRGLRVRCSAS
jgi:hypothetical protein